MHVCMCSIRMPAVLKGQEKVLDPLELELRMVMSQYVGAGNQNLVPLRAANAPKH